MDDPTLNEIHPDALAVGLQFKKRGLSHFPSSFPFFAKGANPQDLFTRNLPEFF
jgi:hypothetical protein